MTSKVFISWSGELSKKLAEEVRIWLPGVLQFVKPYFTPNDIEKGTNWLTAITSELESSNAGIICLTKENLNNPWILFEAGAISKNFGNSNVCTILFNLEEADYTGPLMIFQATKFEKADFKRLLETVNNTGGDLKLDSTVLTEVFEMWWPKLESKINEILRSHVESVPSSLRTEREILEEILALTRSSNTNRFQRRVDISRGGIRNLIETIMEMQYNKIKYGRGEESMNFYEELQMTVKQLSMEIGDPELYERFKMMSKTGIMYRNEKMHFNGLNDKESEK
jgi:hypothetical protein